MVVAEHDAAAATGSSRDPYRSTLSFTRAAQGWSVVERGFDGRGRQQPEQVGDLTDAEAHWTLDPSGVPTGPVEERGHARQGILQQLSLFAFLPTGFALRSTCPGDVATSTWTDAVGRIRAFRFEVERVEGDQAVLHARGTVTTAVNTWSMDGELHVSLADGLTGKAHLHVTGPGAPAVNDFDRIIRVMRE